MDYSAGDPYEVLGVPRTACLGVLRAYYRTALMECHPDGDGNGDPDRLAAVESAYHTIRQRLIALDQFDTVGYPSSPLAGMFLEPTPRAWRLLPNLWFLWPAAATAAARIAIHMAGLEWSWVLSVVAVAVTTAACAINREAGRRNAVVALAATTVDVSYSLLPVALAILAATRRRHRDEQQ